MDRAGMGLWWELLAQDAQEQLRSKLGHNESLRSACACQHVQQSGKWVAHMEHLDYVVMQSRAGDEVNPSITADDNVRHSSTDPSIAMAS